MEADKGRRIKLKVDGHQLRFVLGKDGKDDAVVFSMQFMRTLRIPDDGKQYDLPAGCGTFSIKRVDDFKDKVPKAWLEHGGVFLPMWQREAMWLSFGRRGTPHAVKVAAGKINAVSGEQWLDDKLHSRIGEPKQDYLVSPPQPWLDGFNVGTGTVKQFVAMPLGMGYTVEGQVTGQETHGGLQIQVYPAKEGRFPDRAPGVLRTASAHLLAGGAMKSSGPVLSSPKVTKGVSGQSAGGQHVNSGSGYERGIESAVTMDYMPQGVGADHYIPVRGAEMGLAQGGKMTQKIYDDEHGLDTWDQDIRGGRVFVHLVNSQMWEQITGEKMPASPITKESYAAAGYRWFDVYDEHVPAVGGSATLAGVKSVAQMDVQHGFSGQMDNGSIEVGSTTKLQLPEADDKSAVRDGKW